MIQQQYDDSKETSPLIDHTSAIINILIVGLIIKLMKKYISFAFLDFS